jgi:hypothetical protein
MKKHFINDTVEFRSQEKHLYGVIVNEAVTEEGAIAYTILAGELIFREIPPADIIKNFGSKE